MSAASLLHLGAEADARAGERWWAHMLGGDFDAAWGESDAIRARGTPDPQRFWLGEDVRGKRVVLRCLHGYGDALQFLRYARRLRALASDLVVEVPPALLPIASCIAGVEQAITWGASAPASPAAWDVQVEVTELPYLFRTTIRDLPVATHYVRLPITAERAAARAMGCARLPRVGLVWAGGEWNRQRFLPFSCLRGLVEVPGCEFWSLQGGGAGNEWKAYPWACRMKDAAICGDGILPLAAAISQLDLVITIDTLAAHLAGSLGKPAWILLTYAADWRWMLGRDDSPWYPAARLFRQPIAGDWASVIGAVRSRLDQWLPSKGDAR